MKNLNFWFLGWITILFFRMIISKYYQWIALDLSFSMIYYDSRYVEE